MTDSGPIASRTRARLAATAPSTAYSLPVAGPSSVSSFLSSLNGDTAEVVDSQLPVILPTSTFVGRTSPVVTYPAAPSSSSVASYTQAAWSAVQRFESRYYILPSRGEKEAWEKFREELEIVGIPVSLIDEIIDSGLRYGNTTLLETLITHPLEDALYATEKRYLEGSGRSATRRSRSDWFVWSQLAQEEHVPNYFTELIRAEAERSSTSSSEFLDRFLRQRALTPGLVRPSYKVWQAPSSSILDSSSGSEISDFSSDEDDNVQY